MKQGFKRWSRKKEEIGVLREIVYNDEKYRSPNMALGNTTRGSMQGSIPAQLNHTVCIKIQDDLKTLLRVRELYFVTFIYLLYSVKV